METLNIQSCYGVGIDVGKEEMVASCRSSNGLGGFNPISFPNNSIGFKKFIGYFKKLSLPLETPVLLESTGPYHWQAAHFLTRQGLNAKVVNPLHTRQALRYSVRKRKTDKVDAGHLAMLAYQGYGYPFQETKELAQSKALVRHYWYLKQVKTNLLRHENYLRKYRQLNILRLSQVIGRQLKKLEKEIIACFQRGNDLRYLDSIPGITPLLAATILAELYPLERFRKIKQVIAISGLDPKVKQSGQGRTRFGKLSKRGSSVLRLTLYYATFGAFAKAPFNQYYQRYKDRGLHHTAILNILARKILKIAWALLKKRESFNEQYHRVGS